MITKVECVMLECDNCREIFEDGYEGFSVFVDENQALEAADSAEWIKDGDKHYCPECAHYDDDDNLIIDKTRFEIMNNQEQEFNDGTNTLDNL
jgi:hypothetical protein